jgi:hypothetical protein
VLFCLVDDSYPLLHPRWQHHELLKGLSDSEVPTLTLLLQQLRSGSQGFILRDAAVLRHLSPVVELVPSSLHRSLRKLRLCWNPCGGAAADWSATKTLVVDSTCF